MTLKLAMHNWMRPEPIETTLARLARFGYEGIEISGEPAQYDTGQVGELLAKHGLKCWGSVTLMVHGRDLISEDKYVRVGGIQYVKDCLSLAGSLDGQILTVIPSTVGKTAPMSTPENEWRWAVEASRSARSTPRRWECEWRSNHSTASRPTSSIATIRPWSWLLRSGATAASVSTSSTETSQRRTGRAHS